MEKIIEQMLKQHKTDTILDKKNSIKEVLQEITLCGLSRAGFFNVAAFYGGTALRIFHGLERFSEDLDFSLKKADAEFDFHKYLPILEKEIRSYGLNFKAEIKEKTIDSNILSAFLKGSTKEHMLSFYAEDNSSSSIGPNERIKLKFEVDINPPDYAVFETKYSLLPIPYEICLYDMPSLFAGKIHAVICRGWKNRVKGRDLYDYIFYLSRGTAVNLKHLSSRLKQSGFVFANDKIQLEELKSILCKRFEEIDYAGARQDVIPFIKNSGELDVWKPGFFCEVTQELREI